MSFRALSKILGETLPAVIVAMAFAFISIYPQQILELYRYTAQALAIFYQNPGKAEGLQELLIAILLTLGLSCTLTACCQLLIWERRKDLRPHDGDEATRLVVPLVSTLPMLAVGIGWYLATVDQSFQNLRPSLEIGSRLSFSKDIQNATLLEKMVKIDVHNQLQINWWLGFGSVIFFTLAIAVWLGSRKILDRHSSLDKHLSIQTNYLVWVIVSLPIGLSLLFAIAPVSLGRALTSFGVVCLYFITLTIVVVGLVVVSERRRIPLLSILLIGAIAFALFGLNDNHAIRTIKSQIGYSASSNSVGEGFKKWFDSRKDHDRYQNTDYPIYIFAAEGGGIYAAFRTATFLANLYNTALRPCGRRSETASIASMPFVLRFKITCCSCTRSALTSGRFSSKFV
jgi:hypothetical protein